MEVAKNPNMLVAKKSTKDKLKDMYIKHLGKARDEDKLRKLYSASLDLQNIAGSIAVTIFAPEFVWVIPLGKVAKSIRLKAYDGVKGIADNMVGVEIDQKENLEDSLYLNEEEREQILDGAKKVITSIFNKNTSTSQENIVEEKGRSR